jgi:hypothetical protein
MAIFIIVLSICGLLTSLGVVGIIPSIIAFCLSTYFFVKEKSINMARAMAISAVGIVLPFIMYINSYGFGLPKVKNQGLGIITQIIYDNYTNFGLDMSFLIKEEQKEEQEEEMPVNSEDTTMLADSESDDEDEIYYVSSPEVAGASVSLPNEVVFDDAQVDEDSIFESIDSAGRADGKDHDSGMVAPSDDSMPSYGGLPVGTILLGQYFREDDHNCNPILLLQNETEKPYRYECLFIARNEEGEELAVSEKTVEVVKPGDKFVFEGRFDKAQLQDKLPDMYEFSVTRRTPYEQDMSEEVAVYSRINGSTVVLTADNVSSSRVKVDAYVLFFDGTELVDCIWMIPQNTGEVCIEPGSMASVKGDAYYRFDRIETYYTAYEAVGEE